jgi:hypothetical protein
LDEYEQRPTYDMGESTSAPLTSDLSPCAELMPAPDADTRVLADADIDVTPEQNRGPKGDGWSVIS